MALVMGGVTDRNTFQVSWAAEGSSSEQKKKKMNGRKDGLR